MLTYIILHNMIFEDNGDMVVKFSNDECGESAQFVHGPNGGFRDFSGGIPKVCKIALCITYLGVTWLSIHEHTTIIINKLHFYLMLYYFIFNVFLYLP